MADDGVAKVAELVERATICMLTTMTADGRHLARPMALQDVEFDGDLGAKRILFQREPATHSGQ